MFFNWGADAARGNVERHERQLDRAELKYTLYSRLMQLLAKVIQELNGEGIFVEQIFVNLKNMGMRLYTQLIAFMKSTGKMNGG